MRTSGSELHPWFSFYIFLDCILLGQVETLHMFLNTVPPSLAQTTSCSVNLHLRTAFRPISIIPIFQMSKKQSALLSLPTILYSDVVSDFGLKTCLRLVKTVLVLYAVVLVLQIWSCLVIRLQSLLWALNSQYRMIKYKNNRWPAVLCCNWSWIKLKFGQVQPTKVKFSVLKCIGSVWVGTGNPAVL